MNQVERLYTKQNRSKSTFHIPKLRRGELISEISKTVHPLAPYSAFEDVREAIDYILWALDGGKWDGEMTAMPRPLPQTSVLAQVLLSVGADFHNDLERLFCLLDDVSSPSREQILHYFSELKKDYRHNLNAIQPLSKQEFQKIVLNNIQVFLQFVGLNKTKIKFYRAILNTLISLRVQYFLFTWGTLPLISICAPFVKGDLLHILSKDPSWEVAARPLFSDSRILRFIGKLFNSKHSFSLHSDKFINESRTLHIPNTPTVLPILKMIWSDRNQLSYSPLTADIILVMLHQMTLEMQELSVRSNISLEPIVLTSRMILDYKGIYEKERSRMDQWQQIIEAELKQIHNIFVHQHNGHFLNEKDPTALNINSQEGIRLFEVIPLRTPDDSKINLPKESALSDVDDSWLICPGEWNYHSGSQAEYEYTELAKALIKMDHRKTRGASCLAKKIGQYLWLFSAFGAPQQATIKVSIDHLLQEVGEYLPQERRTRNWAGRLRERFDGAMLLLADEGIVSSVEWPEGFGPGDPDRNKGWVTRWLQSEVVIQLPVLLNNKTKLMIPTETELEQMNKRLVNRLSSFGEAVNGQDIRALRMKYGWSQENLAKYLRISNTQLSRIENAQVDPSVKTIRRLQMWKKELETIGPY